MFVFNMQIITYKSFFVGRRGFGKKGEGPVIRKKVIFARLYCAVRRGHAVGHVGGRDGIECGGKGCLRVFFVPGGVWRRARPGLMPADGKIKTL